VFNRHNYNIAKAIFQSPEDNWPLSVQLRGPPSRSGTTGLRRLQPSAVRK